MTNTKLYDTKENAEKVVLIGIDYDKNDFDIDSSLDELEELANTAGAISLGRMIQKREGVHRGHYFGKGKLEELKLFASELGADAILCDDELTPSQIKNMQKALGFKVMSRTLVILDIFASRASSAEGKLQVELAQLKYSLSHLTGQGISMSRLGGGIGTRGPGETKLETDRRNILDRINFLNKSLKEIEKHRGVLREKRMKNSLPIVALIGYTNAGKSTLMNTITNADVLAENKLFATLDTTTRKIELSSGNEYLFIDTVGFIQKLPHNLINAFRATLEELRYADILVHVVDASNSAREEHMKVVYKTLEELKCEDKPVITVFNKNDREDVEKPFPKDIRAVDTISVSAKKNINIDEMLKKVETVIESTKKCTKLLIPYEKGNLINMIYSNCRITDREDRENGIYIEAYLDEEMLLRCKDYEI